jgi:hypothetical protein
MMSAFAAMPGIKHKFYSSHIPSGDSVLVFQMELKTGSPEIMKAQIEMFRGMLLKDISSLEIYDYFRPLARNPEFWVSKELYELGMKNPNAHSRLWRLMVNDACDHAYSDVLLRKDKAQKVYGQEQSYFTKKNDLKGVSPLKIDEQKPHAPPGLEGASLVYYYMWENLSDPEKFAGFKKQATANKMEP